MIVDDSSNIIVDGGVFIGRDIKSGLSSSAEDLLGMMDRNGIDMAVVSSFRAVYHDQAKGNAEVLSLVEAFPNRFIPMAVIFPLSFIPGKGEIDKFAEQGFKIVGLFPHYRGWPTYTRVMQKIFEEASSAGVILQIAVSNWNEFSDACKASEYGDKPIMIRWVRGGGYLYLTEEIAVGLDIKNVFFDVGTMTTTGGITRLCSEIGSHRLFFSSNYPLAYERCAYYRIFTENLMNEDREQVIGGTIARILDISRKKKKTHRRKSTLMEDLQSPKIDVHWHEGSWNVLEEGLGNKEISEMYNRFGYIYAFVSSIEAILYDMKKGNKLTASLVEKEKKCLGFVVVNPLEPSVSIAQINQYIGKQRFIGIKTAADYYGTTISDERYVDILQLADEKKLLFLTHKYDLENIAEKYPNIKFIAAHSMYEDVKRLYNFENIYFDIAASYAHRSETNIEGMVDIAGSNRILFGTDAQSMNPAWSIGKVSSANISPSDKRKIFYQNAMNLLKTNDTPLLS